MEMHFTARGSNFPIEGLWSLTKHDDKKFQGELFGICNLFRDLSDKLFTSEIIEMHGEHEKDKTSEATGIREIVDTDLFGTQEKMKSPTAAIGDENQTLADCGIVYAHRNEDVVNMKTQEHNEKDDSTIEECVQILSEGLRSKKRIKPMGRAKFCSVEDQKRKEFSRVASSVGMNDLEFSRWLLSISPLQRQQVLDSHTKKISIPSVS
uniref:Uncharacterized protein n=1 Tax=Avena sativa TaxID=4498 RepID=A0ACD5W6U0_AVESA